MGTVLHYVFEPGFLQNGPVQVALVVGGVAAVVTAMTGTFTVIRGQSFAGHSLSDIGTAGGSGALLTGFNNPLLGFVTMNLLAAGAMELIGIRRPRGRDLATGIVLGASLGLASLFLFLDTNSSTTGATVRVLFGSIFTFQSSLLPIVVALSVLPVGAMLMLYRPLTLASLSPDLAGTKAVPVRAVGLAYLFALALAVSMSAITVGALLSTALLIGPAAAALRLTNRLGVAILIAVSLGVFCTWAGVLLAYDSYDWFPTTGGWPASFFIVTLVLACYLCSQLGLDAFHILKRRAAR